MTSHRFAALSCLLLLWPAACGDSADDGGGGSGAAGGNTTQCDESNAATVCNDANPCTQDACNTSNGTCSHTPLDDVPITQQVGDCKEVSCQGGQPLEEDDPTDVNKDGNACTDDLCEAGAPVNPPVAAGAACTSSTDPDAAVCNDAGACVECLTVADCGALPPDDECHTRACTAGACGSMYTDEGVALTDQTAGDCLVAQCDGLGGMEDAPDDDDIFDDQNVCTVDTCNAGTPVHTSEPLGTPCPGGVCSGDAINPVCLPS